MTTDELLAKLDAEYDKLESELPAHYLAYGRHAYWYPGHTGYHNDKYEIEQKLARQKEIRERQAVIKRESERVTE